MLNQHTPGPWHIFPRKSRSEDRCILGPNDEYICQTSYDGLSWSDNDDEPANARLIEAAPEMYELLRRAGELFENPSLDPSSAENMDMADSIKALLTRIAETQLAT